MDKSLLRAKFISKRNAMNHAEAQQKSAEIARRAQGLINWPAVKRIHVYRSKHALNEVDTAWVEAYVYGMWPRIDVTVGDAFKDATFPTGQFDLIIVPVVAFDERMNRLGFGGGWYDTFLASQQNSITIGLAYEMQRATQLAPEPHDVTLHHIVTEKRILPNG